MSQDSRSQYMPTIIRSPWPKLMTRMDAENHAEADAHQGVGAPDQDAGREGLRGIFEEDSEFQVLFPLGAVCCSNLYNALYL